MKYKARVYREQYVEFQFDGSRIEDGGDLREVACVFARDFMDGNAWDTDSVWAEVYEVEDE